MFDLSLEKPQSMAQKVLEYHRRQSEKIGDIISKVHDFTVELMLGSEKCFFLLMLSNSEFSISVIDKFDDGRATIKARVM